MDEDRPDWKRTEPPRMEDMAAQLRLRQMKDDIEQALRERPDFLAEFAFVTYQGYLFSQAQVDRALHLLNERHQEAAAARAEVERLQAHVRYLEWVVQKGPCPAPDTLPAGEAA